MSETVKRLAMLAWNVIDAAYDQADDQPIERTTEHKLALGYLLLAGFAAKAHVSTIWALLGHEGNFALKCDRESIYGPVIYGIKERIERGTRI